MNEIRDLRLLKSMKIFPVAIHKILKMCREDLLHVL